MRPTSDAVSPWLPALAVLLMVGVGFASAGCHASEASAIEFTDVAKQTREFIDYYHSIELDAEQDAIKREALSRIPAPCCSDNSALTCCCPCNMAKSWWGLAQHLIANEGLDADAVETTVRGARTTQKRLVQRPGGSFA